MSYRDKHFSRFDKDDDIEDNHHYHRHHYHHRDPYERNAEDDENENYRRGRYIKSVSDRTIDEHRSSHRHRHHSRHHESDDGSSIKKEYRSRDRDRRDSEKHSSRSHRHDDMYYPKHSQYDEQQNKELRYKRERRHSGKYDKQEHHRHKDVSAPHHIDLLNDQNSLRDNRRHRSSHRDHRHRYSDKDDRRAHNEENNGNEGSSSNAAFADKNKSNINNNNSSWHEQQSAQRHEPSSRASEFHEGQHVILRRQGQRRGRRGGRVERQRRERERERERLGGQDTRWTRERRTRAHGAERDSALPHFRPRVPIDFHCHICGLNHWTVECNRLREQPDEYPMMDERRGCWRCAQRGHNAAQCTVRKYKCAECGGMHDTKDCAFDHVGEEWHEFYDILHRHSFYCKADDGQVQWQPPSHELDVILWYCPTCSSLIPHKYKECLKCHAPRPSLQQESNVESLESSEDDDDSDDAQSTLSSSSSSSTSSLFSSSSSSSHSDEPSAKKFNTEKQIIEERKLQ